MTRTVFFDAAGPAITGLAPTGAVGDPTPTIRATFVVTGSAPVSPTSVRLTLDGRQVTTDAVVTAAGIAYTPTTPLTETTHRVAVEVADAAGNRSAVDWAFRVDLSTWVRISRPAGALNRLSATVEGEAEPGVTVTLRVNGSAVGTTRADGESGSWALAGVGLNVGANTLVATAQDDLGHSAVATSTVVVDLSRPWADVRAQPGVFSPGGVIGFTTFVLTATAPPGERLASWSFTITGASGAVTQTVGSGAPVPAVVWDGQGMAEGVYTYTLAVTATNGSAYATPPQWVYIDRTPPPAPVITWPPSGSRSDRGSMWVEGTAEAGTFITLLDGGWYTVTLARPTGGDGRWAGEYLLHGGVNRIVAVAHDTTGISSPPSNEVVVVHVVHPPLYGAGVEPATVAAGGSTTLWGEVRGEWPGQGARTAAAWAVPPYGEPVTLSHRAVISGGLLWRWEGVWAVGAGVPLQDTTVYFEAVDEDNLSGWGEVGVAIRNVPPAPEVIRPVGGYLTERRVLVEGVVRSAEGLTVRVYDGARLAAETRATGWNPTVG